MPMKKCPKHGLQGSSLTCLHLRKTVATGLDRREPRVLLNGYREPTLVCPDCAARALAFMETLSPGATCWFFDHEDLDLYPECQDCLEELWRQEGRSLEDEAMAMRAAALAARGT